jgi:hypothetical protein
MASKYDISALTLNTKEAEDVAQAIFEKVLQIGNIAKYHEIHTGIHYDTQIPFIGKLGLVGKTISGCGITASSSTVPVTDKTWTPKLIGDRLEHCEVDMDILFKLFQRKEVTTPELFNQLDSDALKVVLSRLEEALMEMMDRLIWFGDTSAAIISGGGVYANSYTADMAYYTPLDGLWKQIFTAIPAANTYHVNIDLNEAASEAAQKIDPDTMDAGYARGIFKSMINKRDARFKQAVAKGVEQVIHATPALVENYVNWLEDQSLAFTLDRTEDGTISELKYRNTTIIARYDWEVHIAKQDNGTIINLPHRALLTTKENIALGTESEEKLNNVKSFYYEYGQVNVMEFSDRFDVKFLENYMAVAAY